MKLAQLQEARYAGTNVIELIRDMYKHHHDNKTEFGVPVEVRVDEPFHPAFDAVTKVFGPGRVRKDEWAKISGDITDVYWDLSEIKGMPKISIHMINYVDSYKLEVKNLSSEYDMSWEELQQYSDEELLGIDPE